MLAVLCEKANDVAVASRISEASTRFSLLDRGQTVNESGMVIATLCKKAATFNLPKTKPSAACFDKTNSNSKLANNQPIELEESARSFSERVPHCHEAKASPSSAVAVSRNSLSGLSMTPYASDLDALSVRAICASAGPTLKCNAESLNVDTLVEAICSDAELLQILRSAICSERKANAQEKKNSSDELPTDIVTVLTAIKKGNQSHPSCQNASPKTMQRVTDKLARGRRAHLCHKQPTPLKGRDAEKSGFEKDCKSETFTKLTSPNSVRQAFSPQSPMMTKACEKGCKEDASSDVALRSLGWRKTLDKTSGRYYFYTVDHAKVTWENPLI